MYTVALARMNTMIDSLVYYLFFFFQAEDGIRDVERSRGLGDVYKRQDYRGIMHLENGGFNYAMSILKSNNGDPACCHP